MYYLLLETGGKLLLETGGGILLDDHIVTVEGTEQVSPVITMTSDDTRTDTTVEIENETSGETFSWTGDLVPDDVLIINCQTGHVTLNGTASMATIDGPFIHLLAGENIINVAGFSGNLNFTYRPRYV